VSRSTTILIADDDEKLCRLLGDYLRPLGYDVPSDDGLYRVSSRQSFIWPYDERARLIGEHLYEDKTSLEIEEVDPSEAITPARVREIHEELLAKLHAERGERFWVLDVVEAGEAVRA